MQRLLPLALERVAGVERIDPDFAKKIGRGGNVGVQERHRSKAGDLLNRLERRGAPGSMCTSCPPYSPSIDRQPLELGAHFLDFRRVENVLDDEIAVLIEFSSLLGREIGDRDPELGKSHFGVH